MSRHFFSGGIMPGDGLLPSYQDDLTLEKNGAGTGSIINKHVRLGWRTWIEIAARLYRFWSKPTAKKIRCAGSIAGECSIWHVVSCLVLAQAMSGGFRITCSTML